MGTFGFEGRQIPFADGDSIAAPSTVTACGASRDR